jgi:hypothetical protein
MGHGDDVGPGISFGQPMDRPADSRGDRQETLAARRGLMRRRVPEAMEVAVARLAQRIVSQALPLAKILLGEIGERNASGPGIA